MYWMNAHRIAAAVALGMAGVSVWLLWLASRGRQEWSLRAVRMAGAVFALATGLLVLLLVVEFETAQRIGIGGGGNPSSHVTWLAALAALAVAGSGIVLLVVERWAVAALLATLKKLAHEARHDRLTGLLHHGALFEEMGQVCEERGQKISVILIDMDNFKGINDGYGHLAGDQALEGVGRYLKGAVGEGALVARYGGDEFCVVLRDVSAEEALQVARQILQGLGEVRAAEKLAASAGVSWGETGANKFRDLVAAADRALYRAKAAGGGRVEVEVLEGKGKERDRGGVGGTVTENGVEGVLWYRFV